MRNFVMGAAALMVSASPLMAGGIERNAQSVAILFEEGNYAEFSLGRVMPDVTGTDTAGDKISNVADDYMTVGFGFKMDFSDRVSAAFALEQPYGADVYYPTVAEGGSGVLGGTSATVNSIFYTGMLRYKMPNNVSVYGGLRGSRADASVTLGGSAYSAANGYRVDLDSAWGWGWLAGVAWEKPEIAARVALTYYSPVKHDFGTIESLNGTIFGSRSTTEVKTPRSWNLEFQTGVAPDTLVFGSIRWVKWSEFKVDPKIFTPLAGGGLVDLDNSTTFNLGVGRKFNDTWSGAASVTYEKAGDDLVSPLAPTNGKLGLTLAAIYKRDNMKITTGINYTKVGDSKPETGTPDTARAFMKDNSGVGVGIKVGFTF